MRQLKLGLAMLVVMVMAGCSPTQNAWVDRGQVGVQNSRNNLTTYWYANAVKALLKERETAALSNFKAIYSDILTAQAKGVKVSATNPATQPVDDKWLSEANKGYLAVIALYDSKKADLDAAYQTDMKNLGQTDVCFVQIRRLNVAWAGGQQAMMAELDRLTTAVAAMKQGAK